MLAQAKDKIPPVVSIASPTDGFTCANIVEVRGKANDTTDSSGTPGRVASLAYEVLGSTVHGAVSLAPDGSFSFQFMTDTLGSSFVLSLKASDWNSNVGAATLNLQRRSGNSLPSFSAAASSKKVVLSWDSVPNTASYTLYFSDNGSLPSETAGTTVANVSSPYTLSCKNGSLYVFQLKANAEPTWKDSLSDYVKTIPLSPMTLAPRLYGQRGQIKIEWSSILATDEFTIYRRVGETGTFDEFRTTTSTQYTDTTVQNGQRYYYEVKPASNCETLSSPTGGQTDGFMTSPSSDYNYALGDARDIVQNGSYLYASSPTRGMVVYDASKPASPTLVRAIAMPSKAAYQTVVRGGYAYVAAGADGLRVYDLSDPTAPAFIGSYTGAPGTSKGIKQARGLAFSGGTTILVEDFSWSNNTDSSTNNNGWGAFYDSRLLSIDVSAPASPNCSKCFVLNDPAVGVSFGTLDSEDSKLPVDVIASGNYAYVADRGDGVKVVDITKADGSSPVTAIYAKNAPGADINNNYNYARGLALKGNYLYVAADNYGLVVVNVATPASPVILSCDVYTNGRMRGLSISGPWLVAANLDLGDELYSLDSPSQPSLERSVPLEYPFRVSVVGPIAYTYTGCAGYPQCQTIVDLNFPLLREVSAAAVDGAALDVAVDGSHAYVASDTGGLSILDVSDPTSPRLKGSLAVPGYSLFTVKEEGGVAFCLAHSTSANYGEVVIADVSSDANPRVLATIFLPNPRGIAVSGEYLYTSDYASHFQVFDVSNPAQPEQLEQVLIPSTVFGLATSKGYAYVAESNKGAVILDTSDPSRAFYASSTGLAETINLCASGSGLFSVSNFGGVGVTDVTNPLSPGVTKVFPLATDSYSQTIELGKGIAFSGSYLFASHYSNGVGTVNPIKVIDVSKLSAPRLLATYDVAFDTVLKNTNGSYYAYANGLDVAGPYLYSAVGAKGLHVYCLRP